MTHALEWPSLTVEWLPNKTICSGKDYEIHKMILGTMTSDESQNYLMVANVHLPTEDAEIDARKYNGVRAEVGGFGGVDMKVEVSVKIDHDGEVNRARYMPQNPFVVATKSPLYDILVFDISKHPSVPPPGGTCNPEHRCKGHSKEGYGLAWNPHVSKEGVLLSGSDDAQICMWNISAAGRSVDTVRRWSAHGVCVADVAWHNINPNLFGSVGEDRSLQIWDTESCDAKPTFFVPEAHSKEINCLSFCNASSPYLLLTGAADGVIKLWDLRNMSARLHEMREHTSDVYQCGWMPGNDTIFASAGADRRVNMWDISKIGAEQSPEDAEDGPPELIFVHGGHTARVSEFSWNTAGYDMTIASVAEDNILQIWQPASSIFEENDDELEEVLDEDLEDGDVVATSCEKRKGEADVGKENENASFGKEETGGADVKRAKNLSSPSERQ